jgi:hypothetical protein
MKRFFLICAFVLLAQLCVAQVPNCVINFGPYQVNTISTYFDNRATACPYWVLTYQTTNLTAVTVTVQSATGASTAGSFGTFAGTVTSGSNPSTSVSCGTPSNCTITLTGAVGWVRVQVSGLAGAAGGTIIGALNGYKTGYNLGGGSSGSACPSPCPVEGTASAGSPPSGPPVLEGGSDGTDVRAISTDTSGNQNVNVVNTPSVEAAGQAMSGAGQAAVTATAANLGAQAARSVCVNALSTNTIPIYVGPSGVTTSTGYQLIAGAGVCMPWNNTNLIYVIASTTGASVSFLWTD